MVIDQHAADERIHYQRLRGQYGLTTLFIAHDLNVVEYVSDWVAVMYPGQIVEWARCDRIYAQQQAVTFTVDSFPERTFTAKVKQVLKNPTTSANFVTYTTIIEVDNPDLKLLPGMTANVVITIARRDAVLRVATAALRFTPPLAAAVRAPAGEDARVAGAPGKVVYVLATPPGADGRGQGELIRVPVRVGLSDSMFTEVLSGLDEGAVAVTGTILSGTTVASAAASTTASSSEQTRNPFAPQPPRGGGRR